MTPLKRSAATQQFVVLIAFLALALCRIIGPSDLYDKEQPRTVSYTVDILLHHHWVLPTDSFDIPATKPPLFNWLSVPFVYLFGYQEWALKFPSLLGAALVLVCIQKAAVALEVTAPFPAPQGAVRLGTLACLLWLATFMTAKLMYLARPDMLVTAFVTLAWLTANEIILNPVPRRGAAMLLWIAITAAAMTKGPVALLPIVYLLIAPKLLTGSWRPLKRLGLWWGVPLLGAIFGTWALVAYRQTPTFFREVLINRELFQHLAGGSSIPGRKHFGWLITFPNGPLYAITRFLPWSLLPLAVLIAYLSTRLARKRLPPATASTRKPMNHPLAPAILWISIILLSFCFLTTKRPDRYAPVFPQLALVTAYLALTLTEKFRILRCVFLVAPLVVIAGIAAFNQFGDNPAKTQWGNNTLAFANALSQKLDSSTAKILFLDGELTPLQTLLGRHDRLIPTPGTQRSAEWCIKYYDPKSPQKPTLISLPIPQIDGANAVPLALYPLTPPEGVAEFEISQKVPRRYDADSSLSNEARQYLQFCRVHTK